MALEKRLLNTALSGTKDIAITVDGVSTPAATGELLIEVINRALPSRNLAQVCYHPQMGPIETCDTCMVEINGELVRACGTPVARGMTVATDRPRWIITNCGEASIPITFLIDRHGEIRSEFQGETDPNKIKSQFQSLLPSR